MSTAVRLFEALSQCEHVLLSGPVKPDGDSLGACLALATLLRRRNVTVTVAGKPPFQYRRMPGIEAVVDDDVLGGVFDGVAILDGDRHRLTAPVERAFDRATVTAIVDHHQSTTPDGYDHYWVDATSASTCEMILSLVDDLDEPLDVDLAVLLYVGLIFDTGAFRYSNTTSTTHRRAARLLEFDIHHHELCLDILMERRLAGLRLAGVVFSNATSHLEGRMLVGRVDLPLHHDHALTDGDHEGLAEGLLHVQGVEVGLLVIEKPGGNVKLSFRARDRVDVAAVAARLHPSGGGHCKAAGVFYAATSEQAVEAAVAAVDAQLNPV